MDVPYEVEFQIELMDSTTKYLMKIILLAIFN